MERNVSILARMAARPRACTKDKESDYSSIQSAVMTAASLYVGNAARTRVVLFEVDRTQALPTLVVSPEHAGDRGVSNRVFVDSPDDKHGERVWRRLRQGQVDLWRNLDAQRPIGWSQAKRSRPYKTFISAPVLGPGTAVYGMLNIDALEPDAFDEIDADKMATLASLLGAAKHILVETSPQSRGGR